MSAILSNKKLQTLSVGSTLYQQLPKYPS